MKKLLLILFSLLLSFNSYGEWKEIPVINDDFAEQAFIDFDNLKKKKDGYVYWWMMTSRSDSSEKIYLQSDCDGESFYRLSAVLHTKPLGKGESTSISPNEGWTYPAPDTGMYNFLEVICEIADEIPEQRAKSVENLLMSLEYKKKINDLYEEETKLNEELLVVDDQLNDLQSAYVSNIAARVRSYWRYQGAEDDWTAEVYVVQDRDGTVVAVDVRNANVDDSSRAKVFKDSIRRAVYKASPLPLAPSDEAFNKELIFKFGVSP